MGLIQKFRMMAMVLIALEMGRAGDQLRLPGERQEQKGFLHCPSWSYANADWISKSQRAKAQRTFWVPRQ
jgi:hypothetical protein